MPLMNKSALGMANPAVATNNLNGSILKDIANNTVVTFDKDGVLLGGNDNA